MDRLDQARAAARRSSEIAAARRGRIPGWTEPEEHMTDRRRQMNREFTKALQGADTFYALLAEHRAAQAATCVDSPETAISDANADPAHMLTD